jgi:hypothetical protein
MPTTACTGPLYSVPLLALSLVLLLAMCGSRRILCVAVTPVPAVSETVELGHVHLPLATWQVL